MHTAAHTARRLLLRVLLRLLRMRTPAPDEARTRGRMALAKRRGTRHLPFLLSWCCYRCTGTGGSTRGAGTDCCKIFTRCRLVAALVQG